jgi:hypothetical protein
MTEESIQALQAEVAALRGELRDTRDQLSALITAVETRDRRDLFAAAERAAVASSAEFATRAMPTAPTFDDRFATLRHGLQIAPADGLALEFGVWTGITLRIIAEARGGRDVYGFDSLKGLPQDWRTGIPAGSYATDVVPEVPGATLVIGLFGDTLPAFLAEHRERVAFVHVDCDIYASAATVLDHVGPRLRPGSVLVFDEYFNYPSWQEHEFRAWSEYVQRTGLRFAYEGYTRDNEQVVVRVTQVCRR